MAFNWSDRQIYCSELIWKVYDRGLHRQLGQLQQLRDFDLSHPAVQAKLRERYGARLPLNEPVNFAGPPVWQRGAGNGGEPLG